MDLTLLGPLATLAAAVTNLLAGLHAGRGARERQAVNLDAEVARQHELEREDLVRLLRAQVEMLGWRIGELETYATELERQRDALEAKLLLVSPLSSGQA